MSKVLAITIGALIGAGIVALNVTTIKFIKDYRFYKEQYEALIVAYVAFMEHSKEMVEKASKKAQKEPQKEEILTKCCEYEEE